MKDLLESGVHFGHQTRRWDPKMAPYIFTERNGIHIIDLQKTLAKINEVTEELAKVIRDGGYVLLVGTKKQAQASVMQAAEESGMYYVTTRWLGGTLTNFKTIQKSIKRLRQLEKWESDGTLLKRSKKERLMLQREKEKLQKNIGGLKLMDRMPDALFIIDPKRESIAVTEAKKMNIPVFAVVDTNCDPTVIDHVIPGNDDAIRAIKLFTKVIRDTILEAADEAGRTLNVEQVIGVEGSYYSAGSESYVGESKAAPAEDAADEDAAVVAPPKEEAPAPAAPKVEKAVEAPKVEKAVEAPAAAPVEPAKKAAAAPESDSAAAVSAVDVKALRDKTAAGMMDCKKALVEAGGDMAKAEKILKEKGLADAAKRMDRATKEGVIAVAEDASGISIAEVNSETDFVARNDVFQSFAQEIADFKLKGKAGIESGDALSAEMQEKTKSVISTLGENLSVRRLGKLEKSATETVVSYVHGGGRIAALVAFTLGDAAAAGKDAFQAYAKDVAMQVASMNPVALDRSSVPDKVVKEQEEILRKKAEETGKTGDVLDKMIQGQLGKYFKEITLVDQAFVKDNKMTIEGLTESVAKDLGTSIKIKDYIRFEVGESIDD
jgi:small subunit ribosomal protein S2